MHEHAQLGCLTIALTSPGDCGNFRMPIRHQLGNGRELVWQHILQQASGQAADPVIGIGKHQPAERTVQVVELNGFDVCNVADFAGLETLTQLDPDWIEESVVPDTHESAAPVGRRQHVLGLAERESERLLDVGVCAGLD